MTKLLDTTRAAILALACSFLVVPYPAVAADWGPSPEAYAPGSLGESTMPTMNLGEIESIRASYLNGAFTFDSDRVNDYRTSTFCMFGFCVKCGIHGPHHSFGRLGKRSHFQVNYWRKGVKGSGGAMRLPFPWC